MHHEHRWEKKKGDGSFKPDPHPRRDACEVKPPALPKQERRENEKDHHVIEMRVQSIDHEMSAQRQHDSSKKSHDARSQGAAERKSQKDAADRKQARR